MARNGTLCRAPTNGTPIIACTGLRPHLTAHFGLLARPESSPDPSALSSCGRLRNGIESWEPFACSMLPSLLCLDGCRPFRLVPKPFTQEFLMMIRFRMLKTTVFICLLSLITLASASAQLAPTTRVPRNEPLEKYDNQPAPPGKIETSPRMISQFGSFTSFQVNVDANGNNILGDAANECSISVDPTNGNKMTIGWRQFNSVTSNFRQGGWGYTTDGGLTWTFPGTLQPGVFRSDPVTNSNEIGQFFYLSLQSDVNLSFFCDDLWRSTNGGQSWTLLSGERGAGGGDKQWFTIDKTNGPGHGFQYQSDDGINCSGGGVEFQRSTNGGVTWQAPIVVPGGTDLGTLDVDTNGNLFIGGEASSNFNCVRSSNAQFGGQTPTFDRVTSVNMGGFLGSGGINPD